MKDKGDVDKVKRAEENLQDINHLHAKVDAMMYHLQIPAVPEPQEMEKRL